MTELPVPTPGEIVSARALRQHLAPSARGGSDADYLSILAELAPMRPPSFEFPGTPVVLYDRHEDAAGASEQQVAERVRRQRLVFKGRFQGGRVAYVPSSQVPLFLAAYRRERPLSDGDRAVLDALEREGPLHKPDLAESTGISGRELSAALQRLQEGFLVYEEQLETEWDNPWYHLENERPDWLSRAADRQDARREVLLRFARAHVAVSEREASDWSGFPVREVREHLTALVRVGSLRRVDVRGWGERYLVADFQPAPAEPFVAVLDPGDPLVTAQLTSLKQRFAGVPVLKYVCVDGEIVGVATGRWGIRAFDVDDVLVPPAAAAEPVRGEVIKGLRRHFPPPAYRILAYAGVALDE